MESDSESLVSRNATTSIFIFESSLFLKNRFKTVNIGLGNLELVVAMQVALKEIINVKFRILNCINGFGYENKSIIFE